MVVLSSRTLALAQTSLSIDACGGGEGAFRRNRIMSATRIITSTRILALGLIVGMCGLAEAQTLSGIVYEGDVGNETKPLSGVTVKLYCSSNASELGELKASTTTNVYGWYGLLVAPFYQFYNIIQEDLPGYTSVGATSVSGIVKNYNWI